ncbi:hypothetical protein K8089_13240 [Aequorivita sp. F47161]|uniref:Uncharacterized protein n=1 Tax=Aequorivita vitellina TaxID=2874475 RepID=A0A9X1U3X2_9FLAO|nr:hypothetical protein [Aequorivita vitellina]MCG2419988.1 hypothetical protein [Aequorivita vitellina]
MNRQKLLLLGNLKEHKYSFLDSPIIQADVNVYEVPFATEPTKGEHSLESCENCRKHRLTLIDEINEIVKDFPNCCDNHKNLNNKGYFNITDFNGIAEMIADKVLYSYHHIINNLDSEDWYSDIIAYLNYSIESFGKMPSDCGEPFQLSTFYSALMRLLKNIEKEIKSDKITIVEVRTRMNKVIKLIDIENEPLEEVNRTDFNLLLTKYDEWFKAFPFDLPYFRNLKPKFKRVIPLQTGRTRYNKYLGTTENEKHTNESLTVYLLQITQNIISNINGATLYEKGLLSNTDKIDIDLLVQHRKLQALELSKMPNSKSEDYIKVLKKWFKQEMRFIKKITPKLKDLPPSQPDFTFINNFDQVEANKVYEYFFDKLVKTKYIDETTLQDYLISAFQEKQKPNRRITIHNKSTNKKVQEVFYNYYKDIAGKPYGKQQNYVELLGNYFIGFDTKKLITNFSKTY